MGRHTLFTSGARLLRYCKVRTNRGPSSLKGQRMTHREWTIDGVTKTIIYMTSPSRTPERDPLNPMAYEQKRFVSSRI